MLESNSALTLDDRTSLNMNPGQTVTEPILFEPATTGGGSLWSDDDLLGTLAVSPLAQRRGRLSLRQGNRAGDLIRNAHGQYHRYQLYEEARLLGQAERVQGAGSVWLRYAGSEYLATRESLLDTQSQLAIITLPLLLSWNARPFTLQVRRQTDLMLVGFYIYLAYDLMECVQTVPQVL